MTSDRELKASIEGSKSRFTVPSTNKVDSTRQTHQNYWRLEPFLGARVLLANRRRPHLTPPHYARFQEFHIFDTRVKLIFRSFVLPYTIKVDLTRETHQTYWECEPFLGARVLLAKRRRPHLPPPHHARSQDDYTIYV